MEDYASHFSLRPYMRLHSDVRGFARSKDRDAWEVSVAYDEGKKVVVETFDKVVLATGMHCVPCVPKIEERERFKGRILHSNAYKRYVCFFE